MVQGRAESTTWRWRLQTLRKEAEEAGGVNLKPRALENKNKLRASEKQPDAG